MDQCSALYIFPHRHLHIYHTISVHINQKNNRQIKNYSTGNTVLTILKGEQHEQNSWMYNGEFVFLRNTPLKTDIYTHWLLKDSFWSSLIGEDWNRPVMMGCFPVIKKALSRKQRKQPEPISNMMC